MVGVNLSSYQLSENDRDNYRGMSTNCCIFGQKKRIKSIKYKKDSIHTQSSTIKRELYFQTNKRRNKRTNKHTNKQTNNKNNSSSDNNSGKTHTEEGKIKNETDKAYATCVDCRKAFDSVGRNKAWETLQNLKSSSKVRM